MLAMQFGGLLLPPSQSNIVHVNSKDKAAANLTVVMDSKAWLAMLFISLVAAALSFSTALVWSLYRVAVKPVAMMTPAKMGPSRQERAKSTITAPPACQQIEFFTNLPFCLPASAADIPTFGHQQLHVCGLHLAWPL